MVVDKKRSNELNRLIVMLAIVSLAGCVDDGDNEKDGDCSIARANTKAAYGEPEEWIAYDSDRYHSLSWWYWSIGFERSFAWGSDIYGCDWSDYNFTPIN
jgi:hypothetical protein